MLGTSLMIHVSNHLYKEWSNVSYTNVVKKDEYTNFKHQTNIKWETGHNKWHNLKHSGKAVMKITTVYTNEYDDRTVLVSSSVPSI
jgi:hypothetical protein